jgi:hypothetical protein
MTTKCAKEYDISLYIGATALLVVVLASLFFYRELRNLKRDVSEIRQIKNQVANVDIQFESINNKIEEILSSMSKKNPVIPKEITTKEIEETEDTEDTECEGDTCEDDDDEDIEELEPTK